MEGVFEGGKRLERELTGEPLAAPAIGSFVLHGALLAAMLFYGVVSGLFHHNEWGGQGLGGAMQVTLQSAAIPLPNNQPVNQNVLATEKPSEAPAPPAPKATQKVDETAIPILGKKAKQKQETVQKTQQHQPPPPQNKAAYGEQTGTPIPRAVQPQIASNGPATTGDGSFASRFGYYVDQINAKMANSWYKGEVNPQTPHGTRVYIVFTIHRDGSPTDVQLDKASGSPTLDRACERGVQRIDSFGTLPAAYNQNTLNVSYYCEY